MYWLWSSLSDLTSSIMCPEQEIKHCVELHNVNTMLVSKLDRSVDPPALLGDIKLYLQLLLDQVITTTTNILTI